MRTGTRRPSTNSFPFAVLLGSNLFNPRSMIRLMSVCLLAIAWIPPLIKIDDHQNDLTDCGDDDNRQEYFSHSSIRVVDRL